MNFENSTAKRPRVLVAMSGGVDSSVAASLLVDQGYEVIGATMQVWDYSSCDIQEGNGTCCSSVDVDDARAVADKLNIPFYVINCEAKFKAKVIDPFINAYLSGQTPLPCVDCNTYLKFDHLIQKMKELECDFLATGHYAQVQLNDRGQAGIVTSTDDWKDQTYFLFTLDRKIISSLKFPIGHMTKPEVRAYAEERNLSVAKKKDSQGICFVGNKGYDRFIEEHVRQEVLDSKKGVIRRYPDGEVMSSHEGIHHYTYGQSRGLGMDHHEKLFVIKIDAQTNTVWVGDEKHIYSQEVHVVEFQELDQIQNDQLYDIKIRYQHKPSKGRVFKSDRQLKIVFEEPQRAVTPGQAAVIYQGKRLMGGGWIKI